MWQSIKIAVRLLIILTVLTGIIYPVAVTLTAQALFPAQAHGSLIVRDGVLIGSKLIGQIFSSPGYFQGRPSAAGQDGYDAANSSGSNLGPTNKKLMDNANENIQKFRDSNKLDSNTTIPAEMVLTSASGLDPDISTQGAYLQIERIASSRTLPPEKIRNLVDSMVIDKQLGLLGETRINVLQLNIALDALK
ncbi:MAG TPA: potassium-transporting ATPase subunit KdpC [Negativicutes bacterium]|nr:potassium-transporting ATPase subunit KdpC [Negativicutes bacterium]